MALSSAWRVIVRRVCEDVSLERRPAVARAGVAKRAGGISPAVLAIGRAATALGNPQSHAMDFDWMSRGDFLRGAPLNMIDADGLEGMVSAAEFAFLGDLAASVEAIFDV